MTRAQRSDSWLYGAVLIGCVLHLWFWMAQHQSGSLGVNQIAAALTTILPYALSCYLSVRITAEYARGTEMRFGWIILAATSVLGVARACTETDVANLFATDFVHTWMYGLWNQSIILAFNALLVVALIANWRALAPLRLGLGARPIDAAAMAGALALFAYILLNRRYLFEFRPDGGVAFILQQIALMLLLVGTALSVFVGRLVAQMGNARFAVPFRWLFAFLMLRCTLVALRIAAHRQRSAEAAYIVDMCWEVIPWLFLTFVASRSVLTTQVRQELAKFKTARTESAETMRIKNYG